VRPGIDIGIDPQASRSQHTAPRRQISQLAAFLARFYVELADVLVEAKLELGASLAHAREHDHFRCHARCQRSHQFAP